MDALDDEEKTEKDPWEGGADAWSDHLVLSGRMMGPLRSGSPVLTMAAKADDFDDHAMSSCPKPKPGATPTGEKSLSFADKFGDTATSPIAEMSSRAFVSALKKGDIWIEDPGISASAGRLAGAEDVSKQ